jgi:hypothetical protein
MTKHKGTLKPTAMIDVVSDTCCTQKSERLVSSARSDMHENVFRHAKPVIIPRSKTSFLCSFVLPTFSRWSSSVELQRVLCEPCKVWSCYCLTPRKLDYPFYYASLFMTRPQRQATLALRAWNIEIAAIKTSVSKTQVGEMRIAWWKDHLDKLYKV